MKRVGLQRKKVRDELSAVDRNKISVKEAREQLSTVINQVAFSGERIVLTRHGKSVAAVVPIDDVELLERIEDRVDIEDAKEALLEVKKKGTVSWEELKKELNL